MADKQKLIPLLKMPLEEAFQEFGAPTATFTSKRTAAALFYCAAALLAVLGSGSFFLMTSEKTNKQRAFEFISMPGALVFAYLGWRIAGMTVHFCPEAIVQNCKGDKNAEVYVWDRIELFQHWRAKRELWKGNEDEGADRTMKSVVRVHLAGSKDEIKFDEEFFTDGRQMLKQLRKEASQRNVPWEKTEPPEF